VPLLNLAREDRALLEGGRGAGAALAMRVVIRMAEVAGASRLLDVASAHIDGGLYHGEAGLDFARRLAEGGARVAVPTTLNVGSLDLLHSDRYRGDPETGRAAGRLMDRYVEMGCRPTLTCAPYQIREARPAFGEHVAWAESNAIAFVNSVLGARTDRYGDFIDICAAITGRAPDAGLHRREHRRGQVVLRLSGIPQDLLERDVLYPVLGHLVGRVAGGRVPVLEGLPVEVSEDRLKALGAAAASSGAVGLFHVVGVTPEAATLEEALHGRAPEEVVEVGPEALARARDELTTAPGDRLSAVSLGTPHASVAQLERLAALVAGARVAPGVEAYVSTGRDAWAEARTGGWAEGIEEAGFTVVTDTCTYVTPILRGTGPVMTDSAKWAYYAPGNLGVEVVFGSTEECVRSAIEGRVWRDAGLWPRA
jgi:predicted aconitase